MDLHDLQQHDVLDPAPNDQTAARLYVPRQDLHGNTSGLEDAVVRDLRQEDRVALIGPPGSGKSSLTAWIAAHNADIGAVRIPVATTGIDVNDPAAVLNDCIAMLGRNLAVAQPVSLAKVKATGQVGFPWAKVGAEAEWAAVVREHRPGPDAEAALEVLQQVVDGLHDDDQQLLLVFDDTDKWDAARRHQPDAIRAFFHGVIDGWLTRLDGALIASVHHDYLDEHPHILDTFNAQHRLDPLTGTALVDLIRTRFALAEVAIEDLVTDDALQRLADVYRDRGHSIRAVLQVLRSAVDRAIDARQHVVAIPHVTAAL
ncbi:MAG: hypothetical protein ABGZ36_24715 [Actinomycetota bacterium]